MNLDYCILDDSINIGSFSCGTSKEHEKLNRFLTDRALDHQDEFLSTTTIVFDKDSNNTFVGYISLLADTIRVEERNRLSFLNLVNIKEKYDSFPALKIGRIAIDEKYQRKDVGSYLFKLAVAYAAFSNKKLGIGIRFIVVDTKDMAKDWYLAKLDFKIYDEANTNFLYYDLKGWKNEQKR
jgi:GNAT superfamily N-acetyltransferase